MLKKILHLLKKVLQSILNIFFLGQYHPLIYKPFFAACICLILFIIIRQWMPFLSEYEPKIFLIYWILTFLEIIREQWFAYKWYVMDPPKSIHCPSCHTYVHLKNPKQRKDTAISPPFTIHLIVNKSGDIDMSFKSDEERYVAFFLRPRLHLHCPHCGLDEIVCPYCDKPIPEEDKKCPHCGKRVL